MPSVIVDKPMSMSGGITDPKSQIKDFFARPEFIGTIITTGAYASINPWTEYLNSGAVADKTKNYGYIRGTLNIRFYLTPQPFVSGRMLIAYNPGGNRDEAANYRGDITSQSNLPHIILDPGLTCDKTMVIPFHCRTRYFKLLDRDYDELGLLSFNRLTDFKNVNTGTAVNLNIRMTAWMTDVELVLSTFQNQSSGFVSEYNPNKPISTGASVIAKAAGNLKSLPVIGGLMTGVQAGASMLGAVANLFGFTRPTIVVDPTIVVSRNTANLSNISGADTSINITTDPKFGKSIDSHMITGHNEDQLVISTIASRYSLLEIDTWTSADALGVKLLQLPVSPTIVDSLVTPVHFTNLAFAALPFGYWRGTIKYLFSLVKTPYHRGKLRISWSLGDTDPNNDSLNIGYAVLWDISETSELEVKVPFLSNKYWLPCQQMDSGNTDQSTFNGKITITVLDTLTGPIDTASIEIHTWIAAAENIQFAIPTTAAINRLCVKPCTNYVPRDLVSGYPSFIDPDGDPTNDTTTIAVINENQSSVTIAGVNIDDDDACKTTIGESIVSFRSLLKRYYGSRTTYVAANSALFIRQFPDAPGSYKSASNLPFTSEAAQSLITWLAPSFLGASGSVRHKYLFKNNIQLTDRKFSNNMAATYDVNTRDSELNNIDAINIGLMMNHGIGMGTALSTLNTNMLEVEVPQYSEFLYNPTALLCNSLDTVHIIPTSGVWIYTLDGDRDGTKSYVYQQLVAGGDDFTFHYYLGPPEMHRKSPVF